MKHRARMFLCIASAMTLPGVQASRGTPAYMAPELFDQDGATHSTASDFWAFGCVLYQCFCGRPPFINTSFHDLVRNILHDDAAPMPNASPEFVDLVCRLLDKNPATRITWVEMLTHPFWQFTLTPLTMPEEPALQQYIAKHGMAPSHHQQASVAREEVQRASIQAQRCVPFVACRAV
jgi:serine/threonine-protein kinase ULK4